MHCLVSNQVHTLSLLANITNQVSRCKTSILFPTLGTTGSISTCIGTPCRRLAGFHSVKINNDDIFLSPNKTLLAHSNYFERSNSSTMSFLALLWPPHSTTIYYKNLTREEEKRQGRSDKDLTQTLSLTANNLKKTTHAFL